MHSILLFLGRLLMGSFFLSGAIWHIRNWELAQQKTVATGVFFPDFVLIMATIFLFLGGVSLLLGYKTRVGIWLLIIELLTAAMIFHPFWALHGAERQMAWLLFSMKTALMGGLLILYASGPGKIRLGR